MPEQLTMRDVSLMSPIERDILKLQFVLEGLGSHPLLTNAAMLLCDARQKVADYLDDEQAKKAKPLDGETKDRILSALKRSLRDLVNLSGDSDYTSGIGEAIHIIEDMT
jgi:hypothetical protein